MNDDQRRAARLRDTLTIVADRHEPDAHAWQRIHERAQGGAAVLTEVTPAPSRGRSTRTRLLAAAAVIVAVTAVGAAVLVTRSDDTSNLATTPEVEPTGWYIPVGLPDGWSVRSVSVQRMDDNCPCRSTVWADPSRDVAVTAISEPAPVDDDGVTTVEAAGSTTFVVADGVEATLDAPDGTIGSWDLDWVAGGQRQVVSAVGVPIVKAEEIARAIYDEPAAESAPIGGIDLIETWSEPGPVSKEADVNIEMQAPTGHVIELSLASSHRHSSMAGSLVPTDRLADRQPLPLLAFRTRGPLPEGQAGRVRDYIGRWPGGSVRVLGGFDGQSAATDEEIATVVASLRPADLAQWRAFVSTAEDRDRAATASATLEDLIEGRSSPAPAGVGRGDLTDLRYSLAAEPRLAAWEDAMAVLTVHNPTDSTITDPTCEIDRTSLRFIPMDEATTERLGAIPTEYLEPWSDTGPCDGGMTLRPGDTKTVRLVIRAQFPDSRYGPIPAGTYALSAQIGKIQDNVEVEIGPADCTGDASVYDGLTPDAASDLARPRGDEIRIPEPGPDSDVAGQRCDRVNLVLGDDGTVAFARYY